MAARVLEKQSTAFTPARDRASSCAVVYANSVPVCYSKLGGCARSTDRRVFEYLTNNDEASRYTYVCAFVHFCGERGRKGGRQGGKRRWSSADIQNRKRSASFVLFSRRSRDRVFSIPRDLPSDTRRRSGQRQRGNTSASASSATVAATAAAATREWQDPLRHYS